MTEEVEATDASPRGRADVHRPTTATPRRSATSSAADEDALQTMNRL